MNAGKLTIRDFIYVDANRLYSLYAQVHQGLADRIITSYLDGLEAKDKQSGSTTIETTVSERSQKTESRILHDHMYNQLEEKLGSAILNQPKLTHSNFHSVLDKVLLLKINGETAIEDYSRLQMYLKKFNDIGEALAYITVSRDDVKELAESLKAQLDNATTSQDKSQIKHMIKAVSDVKEYARQNGLQLDQRQLDALGLIADVLNPEAFEVVIAPDGAKSQIAFRSVLDRQWLRLNPCLLRALYGGSKRAHWTMIGEITYLPLLATSEQPSNLSASTAMSSSNADESVSPRDGLRRMLDTIADMESIFFSSGERIEVIMRPLAIYREKLIDAIPGSP